MKQIHVWASRRLPVIVLDSPFVFHAPLPPPPLTSGVWSRARSPYQWQQSSVINKLRIFFALICLEAPAENTFGSDSRLPRLIGLEEGWGWNTLPGRGRMKTGDGDSSRVFTSSASFARVSWNACVRTDGFISREQINVKVWTHEGSLLLTPSSGDGAALYWSWVCRRWWDSLDSPFLSFKLEYFNDA